jgi:predicted Zn-dependent peptidase
MEKIFYNTLKETMYHKTFDNGLEVYVLPKLGFEKTYGLFSTDFGSIDTTFTPIGSNQKIKVEDGIAHFLEHKMFDMEDGDVSNKFANLGASTNAFTSSSRTAYLFTTTTNEYTCIELLLDFVQSLYLTKESVEKEKGIIGQEIKMYDDDPDWRVYFGSIQNLYQRHPVAVDIAGTVETVNNTTKEMLEECFRTFYHPSNMMLVIVGNVDPEATFDIIEKNQAKKSFTPKPLIEREKINEPFAIMQKRQVINMDVDLNKIIVSIKVNDILTDSKERLKRELSMNIFFDLLFSKSSSLYNEWLEEDIINDSFSTNFIQEKDYCFIQLGVDVDDVEKFESTIYNFIRNIDSIEIKEEDFKRIQRKNIGNFINAFNSPESIASMFSRYYFEGIVAMELVDEIAKITLEDIESVKKYFIEEYTTSCIVRRNTE